jgi:hypothetical protein
MQLLDHKDLQTEARAADRSPQPEQTSNDARSEKDLQIGAVQKAAHPSAKQCRLHYVKQEFFLLFRGNHRQEKLLQSRALFDR